MGRVRGMPAAGPVLGLAAAAVLLLGYGWLRHVPGQPFVADRAEITALLQRSTLAVALAGVTVAAILPLRRSARWARLAQLLGPALLVLAVSGLIALYSGGTAQIVAAAAVEQQGLRPVSVVGVARAAWWCAGLAVAALALAVLGSYRQPPGESAAPAPAPAPTPRRGPACAAAAAVAVVAVVGAGVTVVATTDGAGTDRTAARIEPPPAPALTGEVAYRFDDEKFVPAGAGFVRLIGADGGYGAKRQVAGFDGATGAQRWSYRLPEPGGREIYATGTGPDSVVVVATDTRSSTVLIALDATTGTPLWARPGATLLDGRQRSVTAQVVLTVERFPERPDRSAASATRWVALSPRTGQTLWTRTFGYRCAPSVRLTDVVALVDDCPYVPGVLATVLDPVTGADRGVLTAAALGVAPADLGPDVGEVTIHDAVGELAVVAVRRYHPADTTRLLVVDAAAGRVLHRMPPATAATFIDDRSLLLTRYGPGGDLRADQPVSILDLDRGAIIDTPLGYPGGRAVPRGSAVARVGSRWATLLPDRADSDAAMSLHLIDPVGGLQDLAGPCGSGGSAIPGVTSVPGALLVDCGDGQAGVR